MPKLATVSVLLLAFVAANGLAQFQDTKRTLVVVFGMHRGGPHAWNSFFRHLIRPLAADLALLVPNHFKSAELVEQAQYVWSFDEPSSWKKVLQSIADTCPSSECKLWETELCQEGNMPSIAMKGIDDCGEKRGSDGIVLAMRWMIQQKIASLNLVDKYDWFVITRCDALYLCDHPKISEEFDPNYLWIPEIMSFDDGYSKFGDRHQVISSKSVLTALNTTLVMLCDTKNFKNPPGRPVAQRGIDAEAALAISWHLQGIIPKIFRRVMLTVMRDSDRSRWLGPDPGFIDAAYGIHLKAPYRDELFQSQRNCGISVNEYLAGAVKLSKETKN
jgi:hypothetical protein